MGVVGGVVEELIHVNQFPSLYSSVRYNSSNDNNRRRMSGSGGNAMYSSDFSYVESLRKQTPKHPLPPPSLLPLLSLNSAAEETDIGHNTYRSYLPIMAFIGRPL